MGDELDLGRTLFGDVDLGDERRRKRLFQLTQAIARQPAGTLPIKLHSRREYRAAVRLMNCDDVTHAALIGAHADRTRRRCEAVGGTVLVLHDTTELDYSGLDSIADLGPIGNGGGRGYLCHNSLAVDPERNEVLGLASQILHRRAAGKGESVAAKRARKDRESRLWARGVEALGEKWRGAPRVHVMDRGADLFELLATLDEQQEQYVIRATKNRNLLAGHAVDASAARLHEFGRGLPRVAIREMVVNPHAKRPLTRRFAIGFTAIQILPPHVRRGEYTPRPLPLWLIHVQEVDACGNVLLGPDPKPKKRRGKKERKAKQPSANEPRTEWFLLTNRPLAAAEDAVECVGWYGRRWIIEEFHKAQKTGCGVEELQFTTSAALEPMIAVLSVIATALLKLREAARRPEADSTPAETVSDRASIRMLSGWRYDDPRRPLTVLEYTLALGRLGGHFNRRSDGLPGWLTLWRGRMALEHMLAGVAAMRLRCGES